MKTTLVQLPQKYHGNNSGNSSSHHRRGSEENNKNSPPRSLHEEEDNETASCFSAGSTFSWSLCKGWSPRKTIKNVKPKLTIEGNNKQQQQSCINLLLDTTTTSIISNELIELLDDESISNVSDDDDEFLFHTEAEATAAAPSGPPTYVIASSEEKSASPRAPDNVRSAADKVATAPLWESSFLKDATTKEEAAATTRTTKSSKHNTKDDNMAPYSRCPASASNGIMLIRSPSGRKCHLELDVLGLESSSSSLDDTTTTTTTTTTKGEDQEVPSTPSSSSCRQQRKRCSVQGFLTPKVPHAGGGNKQAKKLPLSTPRMPRKDAPNGKFVVDTQGPGQGLVWVRAPGSPRAHLELDITTSPQEKKHMFVTAGGGGGGNFKESSSPCSPLRNATWAPMA